MRIMRPWKTFAGPNSQVVITMFQKTLQTGNMFKSP